MPHEQVDETHVFPVGHALEHVPQWLLFVDVSTQAPEHAVVGGGQIATQLPFEQAPEQAWPQLPQFFGSTLVSVQPEGHELKPA